MSPHNMIQNLILLGCISAYAQAFTLAPSSSSSSRHTIAFTRHSCQSNLMAMLPQKSLSSSSSSSCLRMSVSAEEDVDGAAAAASSEEETEIPVEVEASTEVEVEVSTEVEAEVSTEVEAEVSTEVEVEASTEVAPAEAEASGEEEGEAAAPVEEKKEEGFTAYVVNISYDTQNWQLRELFSAYGTVQRVFMPQDRETGKTKGIAFVTMSTMEELEASIADLNESQVDGRTMFVDKAKPKGSGAQGGAGGAGGKNRRGRKRENETKLYVGNLSYDTTTDDLLEHFSQFGEVTDVYIPMDRDTGSSRGFGFLSMNKENANTAIQESAGVELQGRQIQVNESLPKGQRKKNDTKIYVGNVPFDTSEEAVVELFEEYGPVVDFYMPIDRNFGRPRGFAFVTLAPEHAEQAIEELDGYELDGRFLRVNAAQPKGSFQPRNDYNEGYGGDDDGFYDDSGDWGSDDGY